MEEDEIGLNAGGKQTLDALLEVLKVSGIEAREIVLLAARAVVGQIFRNRGADALKWHGHGLQRTQRLGKHAHADFVEAGLLQVFKRLLVERRAHKSIGVTGGSEGKIWRSICVLEVKLMRSAHGAVIFRAGRNAVEGRGQAVKLASAGGGFHRPAARGIR
jgi:hypothetical protein